MKIPTLIALASAFLMISVTPKDVGQTALKKQKIKFYPRSYSTREVYVGYSSDPRQLRVLKRIYELVGQKVPVNILVAMDEVPNAHEQFSKNGLAESFKLTKVIPTQINDTLWIQDLFEQGTLGGKQVLYEVPYLGRESPNLTWSMALIKNYDIAPHAIWDEMLEQSSDGDYGGNIEPFPGNLVVVGDNMNLPLRRHLSDQTDQELLDINISWLTPGHVDEVLSFMPTGSGKCDFVIARASPLKAMEILTEGPYMVSRSFVETMFNERNFSDLSPAQEKSFACFYGYDLEADIDFSCDELRRANEAYEAAIVKSAVKLRNRVEQKTGCKNVALVPMPQLFAPEKRSESYGGKGDRAVGINPNPINNILVGETYILPSQPIDVFQKYLDSALRKTKIKYEFFDSSYLHNLEGGLHCNTNIVYK